MRSFEHPRNDENQNYNPTTDNSKQYSLRETGSKRVDGLPEEEQNIHSLSRKERRKLEKGIKPGEESRLEVAQKLYRLQEDAHNPKLPPEVRREAKRRFIQLRAHIANMGNYPRVAKEHRRMQKPNYSPDLGYAVAQLENGVKKIFMPNGAEGTCSAVGNGLCRTARHLLLDDNGRVMNLGYVEGMGPFEVVEISPSDDIAIIFCPQAQNMPPAFAPRRNGIRVGEELVIGGFPGNMEIAKCKVLSQKEALAIVPEEEWKDIDGDGTRDIVEPGIVYGFAPNVKPGYSGGPCLNAKGECVATVMGGYKGTGLIKMKMT